MLFRDPPATLRRIFCEAPEKVVIGEFPLTGFTPRSIGGRTLFSLISAGTEINGPYLNTQGWPYPISMGYAAVFRVDYVGAEVNGFQPGDLAFCMGQHASYQLLDAEHALRLPAGLAPQAALFARMTAVSGATLSRTGIHPGEQVVVTGLGAVGVMAMQLYSCCGYQVTGMDPDEHRARLAAQITGLPAFCALGEEYNDRFGLALECSGTQQAALECCRLARPGGEISLVGVPWKQTGDVQSYLLLNRIFYKYLKCYTGWEMNLPLSPSMAQPDSQLGNLRLALSLLSQGRMRTEGMYVSYPYQEAAGVYRRLYERQEKHISVILDWNEEEFA